MAKLNQNWKEKVAIAYLVFQVRRTAPICGKNFQIIKNVCKSDCHLSEVEGDGQASDQSFFAIIKMKLSFEQSGIPWNGCINMSTIVKKSIVGNWWDYEIGTANNTCL